jgi:hypothetical protein
MLNLEKFKYGYRHLPRICWREAATTPQYPEILCHCGETVCLVKIYCLRREADDDTPVR